jgi:intein/homing endonuclease
VKVKVPYKPRPEQLIIHKEMFKHRFSVVVAHRRLGKTLAMVNHLILSASRCEKQRPRYAYIAPLYAQAKGIAWDYLKHYTAVFPNVKANESELWVEIPSASGDPARIRLYGSDNPDTLRGLYFDGVVIDEVAQCKPQVWGEIIRPALTDRQGWCAFIGCVKGDTRVLTKFGFKRIDSFESELPSLSLPMISSGNILYDYYKSYHPCSEELYGLNRSFHSASEFYENGVSDTKRLISSKGYLIEGTLNHPLLTMGEDGVPAWTELQDIHVGDYIAIARGMDVWGDEDPSIGFQVKEKEERRGSSKAFKNQVPDTIKMDDNLAYFMGLWIAEGSYDKPQNRVTITCGDPDIGDFLMSGDVLGFKFIPQKHRQDQWRLASEEFVQYMDYIGMPLVKAPQKYIPEWVFRASKSHCLNFLAGMFDGDGHIRIGRNEAGYSSTSERLIDDLQLLLLNVGVISRKTSCITEPTKRVKVKSTVYQLFIESDSMDALKQLPLKINRKRTELQAKDVKWSRKDIIPNQDKLMKDVRSKRKFYRGKTISQSYLLNGMRFGKISFGSLERFLEDHSKLDFLESYQTLKKNFHDNYYWDVVSSIEDSTAYTYDFVIPDTHSFLSNGFISHNTPAGMNLFFELYSHALQDPDWYAGNFPVTETNVLPESELQLARKSMTDAQYRREFLCDFSASSEDILIPLDLVLRATKRNNHPQTYAWAPIIIGVDVARFGDDSSVIYVRQGNHTIDMKSYKDVNLMTFADSVAGAIQRHHATMCFVDVVGIGAGVMDRLTSLGFDNVIGVNAGYAPDNPRYKNKRAEMWDTMKKWLEDGGDIPNDPILIAQLSSVQYFFDSTDRLLLEKKEDMRKRGVPSPDRAEAICHTFFMPIMTATYDGEEEYTEFRETSRPNAMTGY